MGTAWVVPPLTEGEVLAARRILRHALQRPAEFGFAAGRQTGALRELAAKVGRAIHTNEHGDPVVCKRGAAKRLDK
jgi:hypothetical protein